MYLVETNKKIFKKILNDYYNRLKSLKISFSKIFAAKSVYFKF